MTIEYTLDGQQFRISGPSDMLEYDLVQFIPDGATGLKSISDEDLALTPEEIAEREG